MSKRRLRFVEDGGVDPTGGMELEVPTYIASDAAGFLSADSDGRAIIADGFFDEATADAKIADQALPPNLLKERPFHRTATLTSAAAATAVNLLLDAHVPTGQKAYLQGFLVRVNGATGWGTTATVKIQDTNGTPVDFVTITVAALTNAARVGPWSSHVTLETAFASGTGGTAVKGLRVKGDANGTGSDIIVSVWGVIK